MDALVFRAQIAARLRRFEGKIPQGVAQLHRGYFSFKTSEDGSKMRCEKG